MAAAAEAAPINKIGDDIRKPSVIMERTAAAAIVGGTVAEATGGNFANGAASAAMAEMFNDIDHAIMQDRYEAQLRAAQEKVWAANDAVHDMSLSTRVNALLTVGTLFIPGGEEVEGCELAAEEVVEGTGEVLSNVARVEPVNLSEKLALDEAKGGAGKEIMSGSIKDSNYSSSEWSKIAHYHSPLSSDEPGIEIHYWRNNLTGDQIGYKFK